MNFALRGRPLLLACAAYSAFLASEASAQTSTTDVSTPQTQTPANPAPSGQDQPPVSTGDDKGLHEILVTANRQTQNLQKVSLAVSVVAGAKISQQGLSDISQILDNVPSLQVTAQPQGFSINIRGQGGDGLPEGAVALTFDGVYSVNVLSTTIGFFDVDRIEVLPGPQSTRYGPNSDGGVVNVISTDPVIGSFAGYGLITVGNYGLVRTELAQNFAISDKLSIRLAGTTINRDSYFTPATSNNIGQAGRIKLLYKPSDDLTIRLKYEVNHISGTGIGYGIYGGPPAQFSQVPAYIGDSINKYSNPWAHGDYTTNGISDADSHANLLQHDWQANIGYRITPTIGIDETAAWGKIVGTVLECSDSDGPGVIPDAHSCFLSHPDGPYRQFSNETRLHSLGDGKVKWNLGYYHYAYSYSSYGPHGSVAGSQELTNLVTNAVFGEVTYSITDKLRLIGGGRQSFNNRKVNFGFNDGVPTPDFTKLFKHFDFRAGAEYDVAPHSMLYATASSGFRPGGLGSYTGSAAGGYQAQSYANEVTTAYEIGSKNRFLDNRLQVNADVFYYHQTGIQDTDRYDNIQFQLAGTTVACGNVDGPGNPPTVNSFFHVQCQTPVLSLKAHEIGVESQILYKLTDDDQIGINATYLNAKYNKNNTNCATLGLTPAPAAGVCADGYDNPVNQSQTLYFNLNGMVEPHSPKFVTTASYRHIFHLGSSQLSVGGEAFYTTGFYNSPVEIAYSYQPSYITGDVNVVFTPASPRWTLSGFIRNVSDYAIKIATFPSTEIGNPRTYGGTLKVNW